MSLKDCYTKFGGNYSAIVERMSGERLVIKFIFRFLDDKSFEDLGKFLEQKNYTEAFRAVHTLKGICQNLNFDRLNQSVMVLTEELRNGSYSEQVPAMYEKVKEDYEITRNAILEFQKEIEGNN